MTHLEARVASLEHDMAIVAAVLTNVATGQTLFASVAARQLQTIVEQLGRIRDVLDDGDEWKDFG